MKRESENQRNSPAGKPESVIANTAGDNKTTGKENREQTRLLKKAAPGGDEMLKEAKTKTPGSAKAAKKSTRKKQTRTQAREQKERGQDSPKASPKKHTEKAKGKTEKEMMIPVTTLKKIESQRDEYLELSQRARADLENYRKRVIRRQEEDRRDAQASVLGKMLGPLDDLKRVLGAAGGDKDFNALFAGLQMVEQGFQKELSALGVAAIAAAPGTPFDPRVHEAVTQIPHPEIGAGMIVEEVAPGYTLGGRILRAAKVVVSAGQPGTGDSQDNKPGKASKQEEG